MGHVTLVPVIIIASMMSSCIIINTTINVQKCKIYNACMNITQWIDYYKLLGFYILRIYLNRLREGWKIIYLTWMNLYKNVLFVKSSILDCHPQVFRCVLILTPGTEQIPIIITYAETLEPDKLIPRSPKFAPLEPELLGLDQDKRLHSRGGCVVCDSCGRPGTYDQSWW